MKKTRWAWVPPRGDVRLLRFQESVAQVVGDTFRAFPPLLLAQDKSPFPTKADLGEITLGSWLSREQGPFLEGPAPELMFWMGWKAPGDWTKLSVPALSWKAGRLVLFTWEPLGETGLFWSYSSWRPWR